MFRAVNRVRLRRQLPTVRVVDGLTSVADQHSRDQLVNRFMSHSSSDGTPFHIRIRRVVRARAVGETIIRYDGRVTGRGIVRAWMRSPAHRRELTTASYRRIGVGRAVGRGTSVVTADFATGR